MTTKVKSKDGKVIGIDDNIQLAAFLNAGWEKVKDIPLPASEAKPDFPNDNPELPEAKPEFFNDNPELTEAKNAKANKKAG